MTDCKDRIAGVVNFVTGNLRPVKSATDEYLSGWYKRNSLVYVSAGHACWSDPILTKKVIKKRYGDVHQSQETGLNRMMELHAPQVFEFITDRLTKSGYSTEEDKMS